jgi:hypothetical protein
MPDHLVSALDVRDRDRVALLDGLPGLMRTTGQWCEKPRIAPGASTSGAITITPSMRPLIERSAPARASLSACELETSTWKPLRRAARSMPRITSEKNSPYMSGSSTPSAFVRLVIRLRAPPLGQ